jgi:hypothetical protein
MRHRKGFAPLDTVGVIPHWSKGGCGELWGAHRSHQCQRDGVSVTLGRPSSLNNHDSLSSSPKSTARKYADFQRAMARGYRRMGRMATCRTHRREHDVALVIPRPRRQ